MDVLVTLVVVLVAAGALAVVCYRLLVAGALTVDTGWGRRTRPLGPQTVHVAAPLEAVYALLAQPYLGRATRALRDKVQVLERGSDLVLAAHRTPVARGRATVTVESVRFTAQERIDFRLLRGPVPHVVEHFQLESDAPGTTRIEYGGEMGTDGWLLGAWWGRLVASRWEQAVAASLDAVKSEAERQSRIRRPPGPTSI